MTDICKLQSKSISDSPSRLSHNGEVLLCMNHMIQYQPQRNQQVIPPTDYATMMKTGSNQSVRTPVLVTIQASMIAIP